MACCITAMKFDTTSKHDRQNNNEKTKIKNKQTIFLDQIVRSWEGEGQE